MRIEKRCPVCFFSPCDFHPVKNDNYFFLCPRCGDFQISYEAYVNFSRASVSDKQRIIASSLVREMGRNVRLSTTDEERLFNTPDIPVLKKADKLLCALEKRTDFVGQKLHITTDDWPIMADCWAFAWEEFRGLLQLLVDMDRISAHGDALKSGRDITIRPDGWKRLDELKQTPSNSAQGFVAMWFDDEVNHVYPDCFAPAIRAAGYEPHRVDEREHIGKIDDEIILQIRRSRFVVADATGTRGGVYYEAGFAHGLGIPVFWTCREDHGLHFDVRQYNCIFWKSDQLSDFRKALAARIEAVLGQGPRAKVS